MASCCYSDPVVLYTYIARGKQNFFHSRNIPWHRSMTTYKKRLRLGRLIGYVFFELTLAEFSSHCSDSRCSYYTLMLTCSLLLVCHLTRYKSEGLLSSRQLDSLESLSDGDFASSWASSIVNAHWLRHLNLLKVSSGCLTKFAELSFNLKSLKLFLGGLDSLIESALLLGLTCSLVVLLSPLLELLRTLTKLLPWPLLDLLIILVLVTTLTLDETTWGLYLTTLSLLTNAPWSLIEPRYLKKKDMRSTI